MDYFSEEKPEMSMNYGLKYAAGLFLSLAISAISWHPYMIFVHRIATHIKIGLSGLIYRKVSLISPTLDYPFVLITLGLLQSSFHFVSCCLKDLFSITVKFGNSFLCNKSGE